jgi:hypothetical protein
LLTTKDHLLRGQISTIQLFQVVLDFANPSFPKKRDHPHPVQNRIASIAGSQAWLMLQILWYCNLLAMNEKKETLIRELHERLMKKCMDRTGESINGIQMAVANTKGARDKTNTADPDPQGQDLDSPDMINVIRNKVAAEALVILNPDKQKELLEILKQGYEEFLHELRDIVSEDDNLAELATQKFKDELMANTQSQLAEKSHAFSD